MPKNKLTETVGAASLAVFLAVPTVPSRVNFELDPVTAFESSRQPNRVDVYFDNKTVDPTGVSTLLTGFLTLMKALPPDLEPASEETIKNATDGAYKFSGLGLFAKRIVPSAEGGVAVVFESDRTKYAAAEFLNTGRASIGISDRNFRFESWSLEEEGGLSYEQAADEIKEFLNG